MKYLLQNVCKSIESVDIFGQGVGIRYNQRQSHKTKLGGFATFLVWSLISYQSFYIIKELVLQEKPSIIQQTNHVYQPDPFQITPQSFNIALGIQDAEYKHFDGEGIYKLRAYQFLHTQDKKPTDGIEDQKSWQITEIEIEKCTQNHFQIEQSQEYFLHLPYKDLYCLKINQNPPFIEGEYAAERFGFLQFEFSRCEGTKCKDQTEIDVKLARPSLIIYFSDTNIDLKSKEHPFKSTGKNLFWTTGSSMEKQIYLNLISTKIQSDYSIIGTSLDVMETIQFSSEREIALPSINNKIFNLSISYEKNKEITYFRNYLKAGNAFSQVGGFFNFFLSIGFLIFKRFSQCDLNHKLINKVFNIIDDTNQIEKNEDDDKKPQNVLLSSKQSSKEQQKQNEIKNLESFLTLNQKSKSEKQESKSNPNEGTQNQQDIKQPETKQILFSLRSYICNVWRFWTCCKTTESNLINYATNKIYDHIDLFNIIQKLIEVDKLKQLLLNEDQIKLFEYLPKPVLFLSQFDTKESKLQQQQIELSILNRPNNRLHTFENTYFFESLKKSYQNINRLQHKSIIDEKIIKMIDPTLKHKLSNEEISQHESPSPNQTILYPKSIFPDQLDEENDDCIIKIDELNEIFKPKEIKHQNLKSMNSLLRQTISNRQRIQEPEFIQADDFKNQTIQ